MDEAYLIGFSVIHASGTFVSRIIHSEEVKASNIHSLEQMIKRAYPELMNVSIRIFSCQVIKGF